MFYKFFWKSIIQKEGTEIASSTMSNKENNINKKDGHLNESWLARVVDSLVDDSFFQLPEDIKDHIENCEKCKSDILSIYEITLGFENKIKNPDNNNYSSEKPDDPGKYYSMNKRLFFLRIAAVLIVLIGIFFIGKEIFLTGKNQIARSEKAIDYTDSTMMELYNKFSPFESLMESEMRSAIKREILTPTLSQAFLTGRKIKFHWNTTFPDPYSLIITNNKGIEVFSQKYISKNRFTLRKNLNPGLYYWKLESPQEIILIGRFIVVEK